MGATGDHGVIVADPPVVLLREPPLEKATLRALLGQRESPLVRVMRRRLAPEAETAPSARKWDPRLYGIGAQILRDIGVRRMRLLTSRTQMPSMAGFDLEITGFVADPSQL